MKKILCFIMVSIMILGLAACGKKEEGNKLVVGLDDTFTPMGFRDDNNNIVGFDIDLAKAVCEKLNMKFVAQPISWEAKVNELNTNNIDCIWNGLSVTKDNKDQMTLSQSYMKNDIALVVKKDSNIQSSKDMAGKKLALQGGSAAAELLDASENKELKDSLGKINPFDNYNTALLDLDSGNSDAVLMDSVVANYANQKGGKDYKVLADSLLEDKYAIGFKKGNQELCDKVWNALKELKAEGKVAEISKKWFGTDVTTIQ